MYCLGEKNRHCGNGRYQNIGADIQPVINGVWLTIDDEFFYQETWSQE